MHRVVMERTQIPPQRSMVSRLYRRLRWGDVPQEREETLPLTVDATTALAVVSARGAVELALALRACHSARGARRLARALHRRVVAVAGEPGRMGLLASLLSHPLASIGAVVAPEEVDEVAHLAAWLDRAGRAGCRVIAHLDAGAVPVAPAGADADSAGAAAPGTEIPAQRPLDWLRSDTDPPLTAAAVFAAPGSSPAAVRRARIRRRHEPRVPTGDRRETLARLGPSARQHQHPSAHASMPDTPGEAPAQAGTGLAQCAAASQTAVATGQRPSVGESPLHPAQPGADAQSTGLPAPGTGIAGAATPAVTPPVDQMETAPIDQTNTAPTEPVVPTLTEPVVTAVADDDEDDDGLPAWLWDRDTA